jgi:hypothetical protein
MTDNAKKWATWALAGVCLLLLPCAFCGGWLIPRGSNPKSANDKAAAVAVADEKPKANPISKAREEWGYQDIQDHLAANGVKVCRGIGKRQGKTGMWFAAADAPYAPADGKNAAVDDWEYRQTANPEAASPFVLWDAGAKEFAAGLFFVEDHGTPSEAKRYVASLADVHQEQATAWSKYVIFGWPEKRAKLTKILP